MRIKSFGPMEFPRIRLYLWCEMTSSTTKSELFSVWQTFILHFSCYSGNTRVHISPRAGGEGQKHKYRQTFKVSRNKTVGKTKNRPFTCLYGKMSHVYRFDRNKYPGRLFSYNGGPDVFNGIEVDYKGKVTIFEKKVILHSALKCVMETLSEWMIQSSQQV